MIQLSPCIEAFVEEVVVMLQFCKKGKTGTKKGKAIASRTDEAIVSELLEHLRPATICMVAVAHSVANRCSECDSLAGGGGAEAVDARPVWDFVLKGVEDDGEETSDLDRIAQAMQSLKDKQTTREKKRLEEAAKLRSSRQAQRQKLRGGSKRGAAVGYSTKKAKRVKKK